MFKRKKALPVFRQLFGWIWPKSGWVRATNYTIMRLRRLPGRPEAIALGIALGIFVCFTPFVGFHFIIAGLLAVLLRANVTAALIATFFGNPVTFPLIGSVSMLLGNFILGRTGQLRAVEVFKGVVGAFSNLWENFLAIFTNETANWDRLLTFFNEIFLPYTIGGLVPGIIFSIAAYYISLPILRLRDKRQKIKLSL